MGPPIFVTLCHLRFVPHGRFYVRNIVLISCVSDIVFSRVNELSYGLIVSTFIVIIILLQ